MRAEGVKVGILKPRLYRPFPAQQIVDCIKNCKAVGVLDRAISFGAPQGMGPLYTDITAGLFNSGVSGLPIVNYIYGLGGVTPPMIGRVRRSRHRRHERRGDMVLSWPARQLRGAARVARFQQQGSDNDRPGAHKSEDIITRTRVGGRASPAPDVPAHCRAADPARNRQPRGDPTATGCLEVSTTVYLIMECPDPRL